MNTGTNRILLFVALALMGVGLAGCSSSYNKDRAPYMDLATPSVMSRAPAPRAVPGENKQLVLPPMQDADPNAIVIEGDGK